MWVRAWIYHDKVNDCDHDNILATYNPKFKRTTSLMWECHLDDQMKGEQNTRNPIRVPVHWDLLVGLRSIE